MLDLLQIMATPRSTDAPPQSGKKPIARDTKDDARQEFQSEYDAATEERKTTQDDRAAKAGSATEANDAEASEEIGKHVSAASQEADDNDDQQIPGAIAGEERARAVAEGKAALGLQVEKAASVSADKKTDGLATTGTSPSGVSEETNNVSKDAAGTKPGTENQKNSTAESIFMSRANERASAGAIDASGKSAVSTGTTATQISNDEAQKRKTSIAPTTTVSEKLTPRDTKTPSRDETLSKGAEVKSTQSAAAPSVTNKIGLVSTVPQATSKLDVSKEKSDTLLLTTGDVDGLASWETRSSSQVHQASLAQTLNRAETPAMIARQMAEALQKLPDRPVEVSLNPKELGRVRMNISAVETGITVTIVAERPETLDLMRRNIEHLAREFQTIGYDSIDFAFSEGETQEGFGEEGENDGQSGVSHLDLAMEQGPQESDAPLSSASSGIDIRL